MPEASTLLEMYRAMRDHFGHQHWWPGEGALEICLGAILTQNTNWGNVERALENLKAEGLMDLACLDEVPAERLAELIRPAGYFNVKARRLKCFLRHIRNHWGGNLNACLDRPAEVLRPELLGIHGIGPETADSIILYAAGQATFVIDAYTMRIFRRHSLIDSTVGYEDVRSMCQHLLPRDVELWNDYHAQLVAVGKHFCRPRAQCVGCPLERFDHNANL